MVVLVSFFSIFPPWSVAPLVWVPWVPGNPSIFEQWVLEPIKFGEKVLRFTPFSVQIKQEMGVNFESFFPKLIGSGTHCSKIDGFPRTHETLSVTEPLTLVMPFLLTSVVTKSCLQIHLIRDLIPSCDQTRIPISFRSIFSPLGQSSNLKMKVG